MEIIKIVSCPDCKIITCKCDWSPCTGSKTMRFLGETYERIGWDDIKKEIYYRLRIVYPFHRYTHTRSF